MIADDRLSAVTSPRPDRWPSSRRRRRPDPEGNSRDRRPASARRRRHPVAGCPL